MDSAINKYNPQFCGLLYGKIGNHNKIKISYSDKGLKKIFIETEELPKINIFEKIFFNATKIQSKALKMRQKGVISSFIYQFNELEFKHLKEDYLFITKKQLNKFSEIIKKNSPKNIQEFLDEFFATKI